VLVHGYGVSGRYMLPLARALVTEHFVLVPDLPGHGRSERPPKAPDIGDLADALGGLLDASGLVRPVFVANSMGCQTVTELAVRRPDRVGPMVLIGPTVEPGRRALRHHLIGGLRESAREPAPLVALATREGASRSLGPLLTAARSALSDRIEERLPLIEQPAVVVYGDQDGFVSREWAEQVAALLPDGRLVVVPGEPHAVHYTQPALVAGIVGELLVEKVEHGSGQLARGFPHRDVSARQPNEQRVGNSSLPLLGDRGRYEPVTLAPHE
jgi:2-hydroxy-6-oxonona-2,4-dienedioate hydrolase